MVTIIIKAEGASLSKVKSFLDEMQIPFKIKKTKKVKAYDPEFVEMILEATNEEGGTIIDPENIWESIKNNNQAKTHKGFASN